MNTTPQTTQPPGSPGERTGEDRHVRRLLEAVADGRVTDDPVARAAGREAWHELVAREYDRVRALVVLFRFPDHPDVAIGESDRDDAVQEAFARLLRMVDGFRGSSVGEFRKALRTAVNFACMDFCRRRLARERHHAGSLQEPAGPDTQTGRFDHEIAALAARSHHEHYQTADTLAEMAHGIEQLSDERQRQVIRLTAAGYDTEEIAAALDTSPGNVHQLRSRALRQLRRTIT